MHFVNKNKISMNLRIIFLVTCYFVNVFANQSNWIIHNNDDDWNDDDFLSKESLLPVKTKTVHKPKPVKVNPPPKPLTYQSKTELVQSKTKPVSKDIPKTVDKLKTVAAVKKPSLPVEDGEDELSSQFIVVQVKNKKANRHPKTKPTTVSTPAPTKTTTVSVSKEVPPVQKSKVPCSDKDVKCLLAEEDLLAQPKAPKHPPPPRFVPSPKLKVQDHKVVETPSNPKDHSNRHLLFTEYEIHNTKDSDEDILNSISDEQVKRYRRQVADGSGSDFFAQTASTTEDTALEFEISQTIKLNTNMAVMTESDRALYEKQFKEELTRLYQPFPGFKRIDIKEVKLDSDGRPTADFSIVLNGGLIGALGQTPEERLQNILGHIDSAGDVYKDAQPILGSNIIDPNIDLELFKQRVELLLNDVCNATNSCPDGYYCTPEKTELGSYASSEVCVHKCFQTKLDQLCQNNAICTLDTNNEPYCQCGSLHTGFFCENEKSVASSSLSTPEVVGITTGTLLAVAALASCCFFVLFCRKRGQDMEYSYNGDDDNLMGGYMDQASNLGISNMYIDRPRISIQPLDIYNDPAYA